MTPVQTYLNRTLAHSNLDYDTKIGTDGGEKGRWREEFSFLFLFLFCLCDSPSLLFASWLLCYLLFLQKMSLVQLLVGGWERWEPHGGGMMRRSVDSL